MSALLPVLWIPSSPAFTWTLLHQSSSFSLGYLQPLFVYWLHRISWNYTKLKKKFLYGSHENVFQRPLTKGASYCALKFIPPFALRLGSPQAAPSLCQREGRTLMWVPFWVVGFLWWLTLAWGFPNGFVEPSLDCTAIWGTSNFPSLSLSLMVRLSQPF